MNRIERIFKIQSISDRIIHYLKIELPDLQIECIYTNKKILSRYISINVPEDEHYIIRISDHDNDNKDTYDFNVIIDLSGEFKLCSTVMGIVSKINIGDK